jgi:hypothetical protein
VFEGEFRFVFGAKRLIPGASRIYLDSTKPNWDGAGREEVKAELPVHFVEKETKVRLLSHWPRLRQSEQNRGEMRYGGPFQTTWRNDAESRGTVTVSEEPQR